MSTWQPSHFETEGSVQTRTGKICYRAVGEDMVFEGAEGKPEASIFSFSYFRTDTAEKDRPVLFFYNGGPGSSCVWMHLGLMGP